jgi:hypothetical protein
VAQDISGILLNEHKPNSASHFSRGLIQPNGFVVLMIVPECSPGGWQGSSDLLMANFKSGGISAV